MIQPFTLQLNEEDITIPEFSGKLLKNGKEVTIHSSINNGDHIQIIKMKQPTVSELAVHENWLFEQTMPVSFNGQNILLSKKLTKIIRNGEELNPDDIVFSGDVLSIKKKEAEPFIFQDVFRFVDYQLPREATGGYMLLKNGENSSFHEPIEAGDHLEIKWLKEK